MRAVIVVVLMATLFLGTVTPGIASAAEDKAPKEIAEETFIDHGAPVHDDAYHGPAATEESDKFHLTNGGISWPSDDDVEYAIIGTDNDVGEATSAIQDAEAT